VAVVVVDYVTAAAEVPVVLYIIHQCLLFLELIQLLLAMVVVLYHHQLMFPVFLIVELHQHLRQELRVL